MKTRVYLAVLAVLTGVVALAKAATEEEMIAEMKNCAICKHIANKPELMQNMTWETHKIDNGMLTVSTVSKEKMTAFNQLQKDMESAIDEVKTAVEQGKEVEMCDLCKGWSSLMEAGAKEEQIKLNNGSIHMLTSDDPGVVKKIHAEADKAIAIQKDMAGQQASAL